LLPVTRPAMHIATANPTAIDYELLVSALPGLYLILAPDLSIINATDAYLRSTLRTREEIVGRKLFDVFPESPQMEKGESVHSLKKSLLHVLNFNTPHSIPVLRYDVERPKNLGGGFEERYWMSSSHPVSGKNGKILYILHQLTDVTMQQMAHSRINTQRERYDLLAQASADVIWDWDLLNNHIWWSDSFEEIFGFNRHDFSNIEDWVKKIHPEDQEAVIKSIYETVDMGGKSWTDTYRIQRPDGNFANVMERGYILRDEKGVAYRMVGSMFDITDLIQKAQNVKAPHDNYQKILDALPDLAWCVKPEMGAKNSLTYSNKAWQEYTGLSTDLLNGAEKIIHAEDLPGSTAKLTASLQTQKPFEQELRLKNQQTGDYRWFRSRAIPIRDDKGKVSLWFGTCTDINEQRCPNKQAASNKPDWEKIVSEAQLNVAIFKGEEHFSEFISPGFKKLLSFSKSSDGAQSANSPETMEPGFKAVLDTVYHTGKPTSTVQCPLKSDGQQNCGCENHGFKFSFQPLKNETGETESVVVVATETTEAETIQISKAEPTETTPEKVLPANEILENLPVIAWASSPEGQPFAANTLLAAYTGMGTAITPETWNAMIFPEDQENLKTTWELAQHTGAYQETNIRLKGKDGNYHWFSTQAMPVQNDQGETQYWLNTGINIETQKRAEATLRVKDQELEQVHQNLDHFIYTTAHDLKKPVNNLSAIFEELTRTAEFKDPEADRLIQLFNNALQKTYGSINHFAEIIETQKPAEKVPQPISVKKVTDEVTHLLQETIARTGARIHYNFSAPNICLSEENLKRVLFTLISNSLQYASPDRKPEITVSNHVEGNCTVLTVQDNGLGIDLQKDGHRMFQMFQRFHPHLPGKGLGLYLLHRLVTNQGGKVNVESAVNKGTTFRVYLKKPVTNILLIDEDEASNFLNERLLKRIGTTQQVEIKTSGSDALQYLKEVCETSPNCPDLIFLDLNMPGMNGFGFLQEYGPIKEKHPHMPEVILISSFTSPVHLEQIYNHPLVKKHIPNPLVEKDVQEVMNELARA